MHTRILSFLVMACLFVGCDNERATNTAPAEPDVDKPSVTVCKRDQAKSADLLTIAVIPKGTTHEFWKSIHAGAIKAQNKLKGVEIRWQGPLKEDDRVAQLNVIETFISSGVDGIVVAPLDDKALARPVREAVASGIEVVIMDSGLAADPCIDYASFVATDNYVGGTKAGERLGEVLGGKGKVLMMRYQVGSASTEKREQGFLDVISTKYPDINIVSSDQYGGATSETSQNKAESLLQRFSELDGIYTPNESTTFGMLRALEESGRAGKVKFVGFDSSEKLIQAMRDKKIQGLVLQDPLSMGYKAVKTIVAYLRGEEVETRIDTGSVMATPENMDEPRIAELLAPPFEKYLK